MLRVYVYYYTITIKLKYDLKSIIINSISFQLHTYTPRSAGVSVDCDRAR